MPKWESQAQLGKSKFSNDLLSEYTFRVLLSCIIRHAVQWLQSPLARRGDFSTVAYVVCFLTPGRGTAAHIPWRNYNVLHQERLICCIRKLIPHPGSLLMWITYLSSKRLSAKFRHGINKLLMLIVSNIMLGYGVTNVE